MWVKLWLHTPDFLWSGSLSVHCLFSECLCHGNSLFHHNTQEQCLRASLSTKITFVSKNQKNDRKLNFYLFWLPCTAYADTILIKKKWLGEKNTTYLEALSTTVWSLKHAIWKPFIRWLQDVFKHHVVVKMKVICLVFKKEIVTKRLFICMCILMPGAQ